MLSPETMVEEDLERDEDDEYLSDMVIILFIYYYYRLIKARTSLLTALEMKSIQRSRKRGKKISYKCIFSKDKVFTSR